MTDEQLQDLMNQVLQNDMKTGLFEVGLGQIFYIPVNATVKGKKVEAYLYPCLVHKTNKK